MQASHRKTEGIVARLTPSDRIARYHNTCSIIYGAGIQRPSGVLKADAVFQWITPVYSGSLWLHRPTDHGDIDTRSYEPTSRRLPGRESCPVSRKSLLTSQGESAPRGSSLHTQIHLRNSSHAKYGDFAEKTHPPCVCGTMHGLRRWTDIDAMAL